MTILINHRVNTVNCLVSTPRKYGVEIDIRSENGDLILSHDPFSSNCVKFKDWLTHYDHSLLILNVKEEGLEEYVLQLIDDNDIKEFFFLDQSFPFLIKTSKSGEKRSAVRFSEYESIETVKGLTERVQWVWVDYFNKFPLLSSQFLELKSQSFKICLVSPELQGFDRSELFSLIEELNTWCCPVDAVCTKYPELWENSYHI